MKPAELDPMMTEALTTTIKRHAGKTDCWEGASIADLIEANMPLAINAAKRATTEFQEQSGTTTSNEDMLQEATKGLIHAVNEYDRKRGIKLSTLATLFISQEISKYRDKLWKAHKAPLATEEKSTPEQAHDTTIQTEQSERIQEALARLNHRQRTIITKRFGFNGQKAQTLREVAEEIGISKEGARLIQNQALAQLRYFEELKEHRSE